MNDIFTTLHIPDSGNAVGVEMPGNLQKNVESAVKNVKRDFVPENEADFMLVCADDIDDLKQKCSCLNYVRYDGMLWIALPGNINLEEEMEKDECQNMMDELNITMVQKECIDDNWNAHRFRPIERVINTLKY